MQDLIPYFSEYSSLGCAAELTVPSVDLQGNNALRAEELVILKVPQVGVIGPLAEKLWLGLRWIRLGEDIQVLGKQRVGWWEVKSLARGRHIWLLHELEQLFIELGLAIHGTIPLILDRHNLWLALEGLRSQVDVGIVWIDDKA